MKFSCHKNALVAIRPNPHQMPKGLYRAFPSHPYPKRLAQGEEGATPKAPKFRNQEGTESLSPPMILSPSKFLQTLGKKNLLDLGRKQKQTQPLTWSPSWWFTYI